MQSQREQMVEQQVRTWEVLDPAVLDAMLSISRETFLPEKYKNIAHADVGFQIRSDFNVPSPSVQGKILQALQILHNDAILQIGAGSGYLSACLAYLGGHVTVSDADEDILNQSLTACQNLNFKNLTANHVAWNNALNAGEKKYDVIVSQYAYKSVPQELKKMLKINGRAVIFTGLAPLNQCIHIERIGENEWLEEAIFETEVSAYPIKTAASFSF